MEHGSYCYEGVICLCDFGKGTAVCDSCERQAGTTFLLIGEESFLVCADCASISPEVAGQIAVTSS